MTSQRKATARIAPARSAHRSSRSWLLLVHQLPPTPSNLRVQTWRRLQQFGAIARKQSVYVLPDTPATREDLEWLVTEVKAAGGEAEIFVARTADRWADDALVEEFRRVGQEAYTALAGELAQSLQRVAGKHRARNGRAPSVRRMRETFHQRLAAIERIDFFGSAGRDRAVQLLAELESRAAARPTGRDATAASLSLAKANLEEYKGRLWVTRPRPGVDRMASAWLIRRFVDAQARFGFAADIEAVPGRAIPYDMFGAEFSHRGNRCTFETLCEVFRINDAAVARIAGIVHDLDLKEEGGGGADAATVGALIEGLQLATGDDEKLLADGMTLFESLYRSYDRSTRPAGPRPVARATPKRRR